MQELTQEDLKGLQSKSLEMAKYFKAFCEKYDLDVLLVRWLLHWCSSYRRLYSLG